MDYRNFVKAQYADRNLSEILDLSAIVLLGVTDDAVAELAKLDAGTVFDLAHAPVFVHAALIVDAAFDDSSVIARHAVVPSEMLDSAARGIALADLPTSPARHLRGIGPANGPAIEAALDVRSIRDVALWPPFVAAKALVAEACRPFDAVDYDADAPEELVPRTGTHATQRVMYRKTLLIESKPTQTRGWDGQPIDLSLLDETGFSDVAFGAILTFSQRWTPRRVALGTLLHSLPLGPGESTRTAVVDWTRRLAASSREDVNQSEELSNSMGMSTAISEITRSVANQVQQGSSGTSSFAGSESASTTMFLGIGLGSASESANVATAATYSVSGTSRNESAEAQQGISSHTHQSTSLARNKRAAVVTEVSQQESESLTTRTVTNYNHMHALSMQYYEVVQIYETELRTQQIERCVFVPMRQVNFRIEANIRKYLGVLTRVALDVRTRDLLLQYRDTLVLEFAGDRLAVAGIDALIASIAALVPGSDDKSAIGQFGLPAQLEKRIQLQLLQAQIATLRGTLAANAQAGYALGVLEDFDRNDFNAVTIDKGALLSELSWETGAEITAVDVAHADGSRTRLTAPGAVPNVRIEDVRGIDVQITAKAGALPSDFRLFPLRLKLVLGSQEFWLDASFVHSAGVSGTVAVLAVRTPVDLQELGDLLMHQQLYYSQQVWLRADPQSLIMQLVPYTIDIDQQQLHIVDYIDPKPVTVAGNYVGFRFTYDRDAEWRAWVAGQEAQLPRYDLLPVPTGGVFCEAVLGESNSAEKLDISRFWNWKDSPIPFAAPDIAALQAGDQARLAAPVPGQLQSSDLVKLLAQPELPQGLAASKDVLGALMAENIFKNLGGVETTGKLLQAAQAAAAAGDKGTQDQLTGTVKGIISGFETLTTAMLSSGPDAVDSISQFGAALNKIEKSGGQNGGGLKQLVQAFGGADAVSSIGPLIEEIAPLLALL